MNELDKWMKNLTRNIKPGNDIVAMDPTLVEKVWGFEEICTNNGLYCGKFLNIKPATLKHENITAFQLMNIPVRQSSFALFYDFLLISGFQM